jgi:DNA modification methylase
MQIEKIPLADLIPYVNNSRTHSDEQVAQIAASIKEFGFNNPVLIDKEDGIIAGHGRVMAARKLGLEEVPCVRLEHLTETQRKAYIIADNRLALNAGWNEELLTIELNDLLADGFALEILGFDADELKGLLDPVKPTEGLTDEDEVPEVPEEPKTKTGDIYQLGRHRLMCGDSTMIDHVEKLMDGAKAQLLHADPPYGMGKESDGVANDNLYDDKLDAFQMEWWATFRTFLEDNASAYIWGNAPDLWRLWYKNGLLSSERFTLRNEIVWNKGDAGAGGISHQGAEGLRLYPQASERCLFFMVGEQGFNNNADNYWEGWEPIRSYLENEMKRIGWAVKDLNKITNTQMAGHWVTKSQWSLITAEHYAKIQQAARDHNAFKRDHDALKRDHDALKRDHDALKRDFYATRAYFDNTHDNMIDVWEFSRVKGADRHGHATPKPVEMMERVMKSSLPKNGLCVEPFGGSGSTLIAAEKTGRICYMMELQAKYCDVIVKRWEDFTGKKANLLTLSEI